jgi:hypothetical protein
MRCRRGPKQPVMAKSDVGYRREQGSGDAGLGTQLARRWSNFPAAQCQSQSGAVLRYFRNLVPTEIANVQA